ncbi:hypothetical protein T07_13478 [Trichinella nelsoni]|uniref:Uncharacterized protein n=1 Tax=Trichinella nelsoni TaxID=6336 RepID=A0A0V0S6P3_9BILA|nr:hypothetical protein T07_13478 [Trichinella nelsoni]
MKISIYVQHENMKISFYICIYDFCNFPYEIYRKTFKGVDGAFHSPELISSVPQLHRNNWRCNTCAVYKRNASAVLKVTHQPSVEYEHAAVSTANYKIVFGSEISKVLATKETGFKQL